MVKALLVFVVGLVVVALPIYLLILALKLGIVIFLVPLLRSLYMFVSQIQEEKKRENKQLPNKRR